MFTLCFEAKIQRYSIIFDFYNLLIYNMTIVCKCFLITTGIFCKGRRRFSGLKNLDFPHHFVWNACRKSGPLWYQQLQWCNIYFARFILDLTWLWMEFVFGNFVVTVPSQSKCASKVMSLSSNIIQWNTATVCTIVTSICIISDIIRPVKVKLFEKFLYVKWIKLKLILPIS